MFDELLRRIRMDLTAFANALAAMLESQSAIVEPITIVLPAGATTASVEHGLGRSYRGAVVVGCTPPHAVFPAIPDGTDETTRTVAVATATAPVADVTVNLWCF